MTACIGCKKSTIDSSALCSTCRRIFRPTIEILMEQRYDRRSHNPRHLSYDGGWDNLVKAYEEDR